MDDPMNQEIINLLKTAVECSVFLSPTDPGLSYEEILEVGKRAGFQAGEVGDAGARNAQLERSVVIERALANGIPRKDIEVAFTYQILAGLLTEKDGFLRFSSNSGVRGLPSTQREAHSRVQLTRKAGRARMYPIVQDIIERRTDGRQKSAEPLDAFADLLDKLGYGAFRLWWAQTVAELRRADAHSSPVSVSVPGRGACRRRFSVRCQARPQT